MKTYDPYKALEENERRNRNDSLTKLRRDRGKIEEFIAQLITALENRGGTTEDFFSVLSEVGGFSSQVSLIADFIMGRFHLMPIDPLEVVTKTGMSDMVRRDAAQQLQEKDLPVHLIVGNLDIRFPHTSLAIVDRMEDRAKLKEIALKSNRYAGTLAAQKLTSSDDIYDVAMGAGYNIAAFAAVELLSKEDLERIVKNCKNAQVQDAAKRRLWILTNK